MAKARSSLAELLWPRVEMGDSLACWMWHGPIDRHGYGKIHSGSRQNSVHLRAHRVAYALFKGLIPEGLTIDHLCRNRLCCNPFHLEAVTAAENVRRGRNNNREKTHCIHGHEFSEENTYLWHGKRRCRRCNADIVSRGRSKRRKP